MPAWIYGADETIKLNPRTELSCSTLSRMLRHFFSSARALRPSIGLGSRPMPANITVFGHRGVEEAAERSLLFAWMG